MRDVAPLPKKPESARLLGSPARRRGSGRTRREALFVALLAASSGGGCGAPELPPMTVRQVQSEVLLDRPQWEVLEARDDGPPELRVISPSRDLRVRGADRLALVLPPPCEVELSTEDWPTPTLLELRMGLDQSVIAEQVEALRGHRVRFTVAVGGRAVAEHAIPIEQVGRLPGSEWFEAAPIALPRDEPVRLRTALLDAEGREVVPEAPLLAGFGAVRLVSVRKRARTRSSPERPNVVLLVMDTQRADRLSAYGYARPTSPALERLARRGLLYEQGYAASNWTWPSTASILTGLLPGAHGLVDETSAFLPQSVRTLAEAMQEVGVTTAGFSANYLLASDKNFDQGFELYRYARGHSQASAEVMPDVLRWLGDVAGTRFFLYVQLIDPHAPQDPLPEGRALLASDVPADFSPTAINEYKRRLFGGECLDEHGVPETDRCVPPEEQAWVNELYDACTWSGDYWLGRLLDRLDELGLADETVVVFTSDHGEELFEHGMLTHGHTLHPEVVRVPLVLAGPGLPVGRRVGTPVSNRHLAPTLARLAGAELSAPSRPLDLAEPDALEEGEVYYSTATGWWRGHERTAILGIRSGDRVLHWAPRGGDWGAPPAEGGQWELYDAVRDPMELEDLGALEPKTVERLTGMLIEQREASDALRTTRSVGAGAATLQRLRGVGYLGDE